MKSYTQLKTDYGVATKNTSSTNLTNGDGWMNDAYKRICGFQDWPFLAKTTTIATIASQQAYALPYDTGQVRSIYVTVGSYRYTPREVTSRDEWDRINQVTVTSNIATRYFIYNNQILLFPTPASANTITVNSKRLVKDLSIADYTTGTIVSIANGGLAVVGSGTTWTQAMAGRFIRITDSDTANKGDGFWYEIDTVAITATTLSLVRPYGGTTISAGSAAYTIGQMSVLPEFYENLPVFEAASIYWGTNPKSGDRQKFYDTKFKEGLAEMKKAYGSVSTNVVLDDGRSNEVTNPNLLITL
jgi:hypothetical protein